MGSSHQLIQEPPSEMLILIPVPAIFFSTVFECWKCRRVFCRNIVEEWMFCRNARTSFVVSRGVGEAVEILGRSAEMQNIHSSTIFLQNTLRHFQHCNTVEKKMAGTGC